MAPCSAQFWTYQVIQVTICASPYEQMYRKARMSKTKHSALRTFNNQIVQNVETT